LRIVLDRLAAFCLLTLVRLLAQLARGRRISSHAGASARVESGAGYLAFAFVHLLLLLQLLVVAAAGQLVLVLGTLRLLLRLVLSGQALLVLQDPNDLNLLLLGLDLRFLRRQWVSTARAAGKGAPQGSAPRPRL
jgi:hypothetical protein